MTGNHHRLELPKVAPIPWPRGKFPGRDLPDYDRFARVLLFLAACALVGALLLSACKSSPEVVASDLASKCLAPELAAGASDLGDALLAELAAGDMNQQSAELAAERVGVERGFLLLFCTAQHLIADARQTAGPPRPPNCARHRVPPSSIPWLKVVRDYAARKVKP